MEKEYLPDAAGVLSKKRRRRRWQKVVGALAAVVVFCTTYALILPAITEEHDPVCGLEEHTHTEACYQETQRLICPLEETEGHLHSDDCYIEEPVLLCGLEETEGHVHTEDCYTEEPVLLCGQEESEDHVHSADCWGTERVLTCGLEETEPHTHSEDCRGTERVLACGQEEAEPHVHTEACYETEQTLICELEEHTHTEECYAPVEDEPESDPTADVETQADWEATLRDITLTGEWPQDVLAVAESQLGYQESSRNFAINEDGKLKGYTRYGAWYGDPYGDWCAMFASFCLHYAEVEDFPLEANCQRWIEALRDEKVDLYREAHPEEPEEPYLPNPGDLIFFDWESGEEADHVGFVAEFIPASDGVPAQVKTLEGNAGDRVRYETYEASDSRILGYAALPEQTFYCGIPGHVHETACRDAADELVCGLEEHIHTEECEVPPPEEPVLTELTAEGPDYTIRVQYGPEAELPEGVTLTAEEIPAGSEEYQSYYDQSLAAMGEDGGEETVLLARFFDVRFELDGEKVEPAAPVSVTVTYAEPVETGGDVNCQAVHFGENGPELLDVETAVTEAGGTSFTHTQDGFSVTGYVATAAFNEAASVNGVGSNTITALHTTTENMYTDSDTSEYLLLAQEGDSYYALGGDGNTYPVTIKDNNTVQYSGTAEQIENLCWTLSEKETDSGSTPHRKMYIRNAGTGSYLYPNENGLLAAVHQKVNLWLQNDSEYAATVYPDDEWPKIAFGDSHTFHTYSESNPESEAWFYFARVDSLSYCRVWLDGTDGGLMSLGGAENTSRVVEKGSTMTLPTEFGAPAKYSYKLKGWYDVKSANYYQPGATVSITQDTVFYADWGPATYDIGQANGNTVASLNTNAFITTHVFDYGALFNVQSSNAETAVNGAEHTETWSLVSNSTYSNSTLGFVFRDWDTYFKNISYPIGSETWDGEVKNPNPNDNNPDIYSGLYNSGLIELLFQPDRSVIGKTYVGTGNYLYQYDDATGYYYYDSKLNAASYNQSASRFYIYNYLERTSDSPKDSTTAERGRDSDFLPFNSPYVNTNGKTVQTYAAENGMTGYQYDAKYDSTEGGITCSPNNAGTNYWFGMSSTINFYLPDNSASNGSGALNQSTKGKDMIFKFSGDDDVWVLVDGNLVLDIGGLHGVEEGTINFSNGEVWRSVGEGKTTTHNFTAGEHTLTIYYLERGGSQSNCAIYFNIAPREYMLELTKTDRAYPYTKLPGAEFTVYSDAGFTTVASGLKDANGNAVPNGAFVSDDAGKIHCYGLLPNSTYYIKETKAPPGCNGNENVYIKLSIAGIEQNYQITSELYVDGSLVDIKNPGNIYMTQDLSHAGEERTVTYVFSNQSGFQLPETGGGGTLWFTLGGTALMLAAAGMYRYKKRRREVM